MIESVNDVSIITPSYKRANNVKARCVFGNNLIIACHEFEAEEYKKWNPDNKILVIPDELRGNMAKVRNFMLENSPTKYLVMIDDDVIEVGYHENMKTIPFNYDGLMSFIVDGFVMAEELGTVLWGLNLQSDPKFYREYSPISFLSPVLGPFSCHIVNDLRYDERLGLNEDYDYALQVLQKYHKILRFNKYYYLAGHITEKGGCGAYRTMDKEIAQSKIMIGKWGNKIVKYNFDKSTNPRINVPLKGI